MALVQYEVLRRKDEEIDELQKILFELRPKLEREVESQVGATPSRHILSKGRFLVV